MGHVVWTLREAEEALPAQQTFWISNCDCREKKGGGCQKGMRVCLGFHPEATSTDHGRVPVDRVEVSKLFAFAKAKKLIARPYLTDAADCVAVCFCCDCCCAYLHGGGKNVAGKSIQATDMSRCNSCGLCVDSCHFHARTLGKGILKIDKDGCYGCGLCVVDCPMDAIAMVPRRK